MDLRNVLAFFKKPTRTSKKVCDDYTVVVPVWGDRKLLKSLKKSAHKLVVLTRPSKNSKQLQKQLKQFRELGAKIVEVEQEGYFGGDSYKYVMIKKCLEEDMIDTKYVVFMDADSYFKENVGKAVSTLEENKLDFVSVNVVPSTRSNFLQKFQRLEYAMAMRTRYFMEWTVSGACLIIKQSSLKRILKKHTLFFSGGDFEIGFIGKKLGMKIGHINFNVYTKVPRKLRELFNQRKRWWGGAFRQSIVNFDKTVKISALYSIYVLFVFVTYPLRLLSLFWFPWLIPVLWLIHIPLVCVAANQKPTVISVLFPLYSFLKMTLMLIPVFGVVQWTRNYLKTRCTGRFSLDK